MGWKFEVVTRIGEAIFLLLVAILIFRCLG